MNRRNLLRTAALAPIAAVAGCAFLQSAFTDLGTVVSDAKLIANGLSAIGVAPISAQILVKIDSYATQAQAAYAALKADVSVAAARPDVKSIETAVNGVITTLAGLPLPPPFSTYLAAAAALLPMIEGAVGMFVPAGVSTATMTPDQARAVLKSLPAPR